MADLQCTASDLRHCSWLTRLLYLDCRYSSRYSSSSQFYPGSPTSSSVCRQGILERGESFSVAQICLSLILASQILASTRLGCISTSIQASSTGGDGRISTRHLLRAGKERRVDSDLCGDWLRFIVFSHWRASTPVWSTGSHWSHHC